MKDGNLTTVFSKLEKVSVCVIGDFMIDAYTEGDIERISPEAPVSVLHVKNEFSLPGGAGNVVLNLLSLGADVLAIGRVGNDARGKELVKILKDKGADTRAMICQDNYPTTVKNRLISSQQQVFRIDHEDRVLLDTHLEEKVIKLLEEKLHLISAVAISDYAKGFLTDTLLTKIIDLCNRSKCPVIVDPKGLDFSKYSGASLIKPNEKEAYLAAKMPVGSCLDKVASHLLNTSSASNLVITRSEKGVSIFDKNKNRTDVPVHSKEVVDVTGAGDTVLAAVTLGLANQFTIVESVKLANICAGIAIEKLGCVQVTLSDLAKRLLRKDSHNKIFDDQHLYALKHILEDQNITLVDIEALEDFSLKMFRSIKDLAEKGKELVLTTTKVHDLDLLELIASIKEVDFVIQRKTSIENLIEQIAPTRVFSLSFEKLTLV